MAEAPEKFAELLTKAVRTIAAREDKTIAIVQDELGYTLEKRGAGTAIEHWRKGHIPAGLDDVEKLARELIKREGLNGEELKQFLLSAGYPQPKRVLDEMSLLLAEKQPRAKPSSTELSPFVVGPPLSHPRQFFGREYELKHIFNLWRRFPLQNVAVIGLKRSGKTSLLHYLKNITTAAPAQLRPGQQADWLSQPERYQWIFVDFQDVRMCQRESLLSYMLTSLDMPVPTPCNLNSFMNVVSLRLQTPTVILMDEIGAALASPELDQPFWWSLRSLGSNVTGGNLAFLLTSHEAPAQLAEEQGKPSSFFNIFGHTFMLGPLAEIEARDLIASSPQPFDPADTAWILAQSGGWPCLLQILCHTRLTALDDGESGDTWKQKSLHRMAPYQYLLD